MTDLDRVELAARRAAERFSNNVGYRVMLEIFADELFKLIKSKEKN
jgi:hypothetical protein